MIMDNSVVAWFDICSQFLWEKAKYKWSSLYPLLCQVHFYSDDGEKKLYSYYVAEYPSQTFAMYKSLDLFHDFSLY